MKVWPNPFLEKITITSAEPIQRVEIFNMEGRLLLVKSIDNLFSMELLPKNASAFSILRTTFKDGRSKNVVLVRKR